MVALVLMAGAFALGVGGVVATGVNSAQPTIDEVPDGHAGDPIELSIDTGGDEPVWLYVIAEDGTFAERLELRDATGDDRVRLEVNTFYAGLADPAEDPYDAGEDVVSATTLSSDDRSALAPDADDESPLAPTTYRIVVAPDDDYGVEDGSLVVPNATDETMVELAPPRLGEATVYAAPSGPADVGDFDALLEQAVERETIAEGDRAIVAIEAAGVFGAVEDASSLESGYLTMTVAEQYGSVELDRQEAAVGADPDAVEVYASPDDRLLYLVIDTDSELAGQVTTLFWGYGVRTEVTIVDDHPHAATITDDYAEVEFEVDDPGAVITRPIERDQVVLHDLPRWTIAGETVLHPTEPLTLVLRNESAAFEHAVDVEIQSNGRWEVDLDPADVPVDRFTLSFRGDEGDFRGSIDAVRSARAHPVDVVGLHAPEAVERGETATVGVELRNYDHHVPSHSATVVLLVDDEEFERESVEIDAGETTDVRFDVSASDLGHGEHRLSVALEESLAEASFTLTVDDRSGSLDANETGTSESTTNRSTANDSDPTDDDSIPGFTLLVTVVALLVAIVLDRRR